MMNNIVKNRFHAVFFFGIYLMLQGCTNVSVKPISDEDGKIGFRYYLPQPYLLVTPSEDGKAIKSVEIKNLPDYQRGYVIHGWSFMATHDLTVSASNGLLSKVHLATDSTAIANTLLEKGGSLGTELIALNAQREAAEKKASEAAKNKIQPASEADKTEQRYRPSLLKVDVSRKVDDKGILESSKLELVVIETTIDSKKLDVIQVLPQSKDSSNTSGTNNTQDPNNPPQLNR